jgi:carboxyl-terminal processing protease
MSLTLRSFLILSIGVALGLGLALSTSVLTELSAKRHEQAERANGTLESAALVAEVIDRVRREYVDSVDDSQIVASAIRGIVADLDKHSTFLDAQQYEDIRISTSGSYTGVGLDVNLEGGKVTVVAPLDGAPAARAGILAGDVVVAVNDVLVDQNDVAASVNRMRGAPGTEVTLDIQRQGTDAPLRFALRRAEIQVQTVSSQYLGNGLAYVRLTSFAESTPRDLVRAVRTLKREAGGVELLGMVLDLRGNPGGMLDSAVQVADSFLADGLIVRGVGRVRQARFEQFARSGDELESVPTVVLVNASSASASEIVAGALQDHARARIIGERTFGKGSVQTVMPLGEGSAIKLTTSRYLTPSGRSINGSGIDPDVVVRSGSSDKQYRGPGGLVAMRDDSQLLEAIRLISYDSIALSAVP